MNAEIVGQDVGLRCLPREFSNHSSLTAQQRLTVRTQLSTPCFKSHTSCDTCVVDHVQVHVCAKTAGKIAGGCGTGLI